MKYFTIHDTDKLLDYGSGKGFAMIFFSKYPFSEIGGVELMPEMHNIAGRNFNRKTLPHLKSYNADAAMFEDIDRYNFFYFYNPFKGEVLKKVLENIKTSLKRSPRTIIVIYHNPVARDIFKNAGIFTELKYLFTPP